MTRALCAALFVMASLAACEDPSASNSPMPHRHVSSSDCANADLVSRGQGRTEGEQWGDVDGDGTDEEVYIAHDPEGEPGCDSFVVVVAGSTVRTAEADPSGVPRALPVPRINSLAQIDGREGLEIVVDVEMGASTQFASVFVLAEELQRVELEGRAPGPFAQELAADGLLPFGGSVGHMEAVDCAAEEGYVVLSAAIPSGSDAETYDVERRFFRVEGAAFSLEPRRTETHQVRAKGVQGFPEFVSSPFGSCE